MIAISWPAFSMEIERAEQPAEGQRLLAHRIGHQPHRRDRPLGVVVAVEQLAQPQQQIGRQRIARRHGAVHEVFAPRNQLLVIGRRLEETARRSVREAFDQRI